jgi:hypothetical protein
LRIRGTDGPIPIRIVLFTLCGAVVGAAFLVPLLILASASDRAFAALQCFFPVFALLRGVPRLVLDATNSVEALRVLRTLVQATTILQWAAYGLMLGWARERSQFLKAVGAVVLLHGAMLLVLWSQ